MASLTSASVLRAPPRGLPAASALGVLTALLLLGPIDTRGALPLVESAEAMPSLPEPARGALRAKTAHLSADGSPALRQARLAGVGAPDTLRAVALLCDFSDSLLYGRHGLVPGEFPPPRQSDFYYAAHDSLYFAHVMADVAAYYTAVSGGRFVFECKVIADVTNLPRPMGWYGNPQDEDERPVLLARDVVLASDASVDFSLYDTVVLIHAGAGEETDILNNSPEQIYSTYLSPEDFALAFEDSVIAQPFLITDDIGPGGEQVVVEHVLVLPETEFQDPYGSFAGYFGSLGVYCFEVGLRLGMLSLSDFTPAGSPDSQGVGEFDLMGYGLFVAAGFIPCHPSAFNKLLMGWAEPYRIEPGAMATYRLDPIETAEGDSALAQVEIGGREYWLLEYRLQDPDGNRIFSFAGDLNGNNIPDFYDADSIYGDGTPTSFFDPASDLREWLVGAEWDFFMSENAARLPGVKGAGSGVYVWHVDEGVVQDVIDAGSNLFNADPGRKSVDLEEADGIQDLDSRQPRDDISAAVLLGGDHDSFRAEGNDTFGSDTRPDTRSTGGAWTGVVIDRFSSVVLDSSVTVETYPVAVIDYADSMRFRCRRDEAPAGGPRFAATRQLGGVDLRGSHLLAVDLDAEPDGRLETVAIGSRGEVFAFEPDLAEHCDGDGDPQTIGVLALGTDAEGAPARWTGPAAAGFLAGAPGGPHIVTTAAGGVYAFRGADGAEVADGDGDAESRGLLAPLVACSLPPVLVPLDDAAVGYAPAGEVVVAVVESVGAGTRLRLIDGAGADWAPPLELGRFVAASAPTPTESDGLALAGVDTATGLVELRLVDWRAAPGPRLVASFALTVRPGPWPIVSCRVGNLRGAIVSGREGEAETIWWESAGAGLSRRDIWPGDTPVTGPLSARLAFAGDGRFSAATLAGIPLSGWPVRPRPDIESVEADCAPCPLEVWSGDQRGILFHSRDGRLYLYGEEGRVRSGWPVAGPSAPAGTPVLADLDGDGQLDLAAVGFFSRIRGREADGGDLVTEPVSRVTILSNLGVDDGSGVAQDMWRGNAWRWPPVLSGSSPADAQALLVAGSHLTYPSPLRSGALHVRAEFQSACTVRAYLHTLEGEAVIGSEAVVVPSAGPHEVLLDAGDLASGMYLCRLVAQREGSAPETSVVAVAVAR